MSKNRTKEHNLKIKLAILKQGRITKPTKECPKCNRVLDRILDFKNNSKRTSSYCLDCDKIYGAELARKRRAGMSEEEKENRKEVKRKAIRPWFVKLYARTIKEECIYPELGDCWNWIGSKNKKGYGKMTVNGKNSYVHRLSYEVSNNESLGDLLALHKCDNPSCVNPSHLFSGTQSDNLKDMIGKGRGNHPKGDSHLFRRHPEKIARGIRASQAKLNDALVIEIRELKKSSNASNYFIARHYGVSAPTIRAVVNGISWSHVS